MARTSFPSAPGPRRRLAAGAVGGGRGGGAVTSLPSAAVEGRRLLSAAAETACWPLGWKATAVTGWPWSANLAASLPSATGHPRAVLSGEPGSRRAVGGL